MGHKTVGKTPEEKEKEKTALEKKQWYADYGKKNLFFFVSEILGYSRDAKGNDRPFGTMHADLCSFLMKKKYKRKLILFPRGHLKTTVANTGYVLWRIVNDHDIRVLIANASLPMAQDMLREIKWHFENNKVFQDLYKECLPAKNVHKREKWGVDQIITGGRSTTISTKEATIVIGSPQKNLVSQHYDLILMDDICNRDNVSTAEQKKKLLVWYKDALALLEPGGEVVAIGTRWAYDDIYQSLIESGAYEWMDKYKSCWLNPEEEDEEKLIPIFPEKWSKDALLQQKREMSDDGDLYLWNCHYLNSPTTKESQRFLPEDWWYYEGKVDNGFFTGNLMVKNESGMVKVEEVKDMYLRIYTMVDPAISERKAADETAIVTCGVDTKNNIYILDVQHWKTSNPNEVLNKILYVKRKYNPIKIGIEKHGIGTSIDALARTTAQTMNENLRLEQLSPMNARKEERIINISLLQKQHKVYVPKLSQWVGDFLRQAHQFPMGKHDDMLDALAYVFDLHSFRVSRDSAKHENSGLSHYSSFNKNSGHGRSQIFSQTGW